MSQFLTIGMWLFIIFVAIPAAFKVIQFMFIAIVIAMTERKTKQRSE